MPPDEEPRRLHLVCLTAIPFLHVLAFAGGFLGERSYPLEAGCVSLLVVMGILLLLIGRAPVRPDDENWDSTTRLTIGCLCALLAWTVITQAFSPRECGFSRIGDTALLIGLALSVVLLRPDPRALLTAAGASVACMTIVSAVVSGAHGKLTPTADLAFGLGSVTVLGCLATPMLAAWAITLWLRRNDAQRPRADELVLCAAGIAALVVVVVMTARRGPTVAVVAITAVLTCWWLWRRFPRPTLVMVTVLVVAGTVWGMMTLINGTATGRGERYLQYRTAWEIGVAGFPLGHGPYGMLASDSSRAADALLWTAREKTGFHAHNELLNAWVEGGMVQVALTLALGLLLGLRIVRCADPVLKPAYVALGTAWTVHAMTDNTFGIPLGMAWNGILFGAILTLPQKADQGVEARPRALRWMAWGSGLLAIITGWPALRMMMLSESTPIHARVTALEACRDPLFVLGEAGFLVSSPLTEEPLKELAIQMARNRLGWTGNLPLAAAFVADAHGDHEHAIEALVRVAARNPFDLDACDAIVATVRAHPELEREVPGPLRFRCAVLIGALPLPGEARFAAQDMAIAGNFFAAIQHALRADTLTDRQREQLLELVGTYGQIKQVAISAMQACAQSPPDYGARMLAHADKIADGLSDPQTASRALGLIVTTPQAERAYPLARRIFTRWFTDLENQQAPVFSNRNSPLERDAWVSTVRIWRLARARTAPPGD